MLTEAERRARECTNKKRYYSRYWAFIAAHNAHERDGKAWRVYHCSYGDHWHLTTKPKQRKF